jgi:hypothetical protein
MLFGELTMMLSIKGVLKSVIEQKVKNVKVKVMLDELLRDAY